MCRAILMSRKEDGFTLTEMLVALLVISLSMASVLEAARLVARFQNHIVVARKIAAGDAAFMADVRAKLLPLEPIEGDRLEGDARHMAFPCDATSSTAVDVHNCHIAASRGAFAYVGQGSTQDTWPPKALDNRPPPRLEAVVWRDGQGKTLGIVKFPVEQSADCQFDMISRTCRGAIDAGASSTGP